MVSNLLGPLRGESLASQVLERRKRDRRMGNDKWD